MTKRQTVSSVLMAAAWATIAIGLVTIFFPQLLIQLFDGYTGGNYHFVRYIGTALLGFGVMNWIYSRFTDLSAVLPAIYGNLASLAIAIIIDTVGLLAGDIAIQGTIILGTHLIFAGLFWHCVRLIRA